MLKKVLISGIVTALFLLLLSWLLSVLNIGFLSMTLHASFWPVIVVALVFGVINAILVAIATRIFKKAQPWLLYVIMLVVNAAALLLTAHFTSALYIGGWLTAIVIAILLSFVTPVVMGLSDKK